MLSLLLPGFVFAQAENTKSKDLMIEAPQEQTSITAHQATINGKVIRYTVTTGTIHLKDEKQKPTAAVFYMAYTRDDAKDMARRPLTFSFNGGPGSSSVWLHLGVLGPKRVHMDEEGNPYPPPHKLVNNDHSILDKTDLVFIDPVATGYSRTVLDNKNEQFHGLEEDIRSVGEFIRLYTTRNNRWESPKFLVGESYGTTRAVGLAHHLQSRHGMYFNGVMLISSILTFQTARFDAGNDLPYITFLPTYTATAWHHKRLEGDLAAGSLEDAAEAARQFALGEYATALLHGDALPVEKRAATIRRLSELTGLSGAFLEEQNMRVSIWEFADELMRSQNQRVGRLDSRFKSPNRGYSGGIGGDPSYAAIQGPYTGALNHYVRKELKFESDLVYEILNVNLRRWNYSDFTNRYVNVAPRLVQAMIQNPNLKVFVGNGYYDLATPFFATEFTFNHLNLDPALRGNISMAYYPSGHMMYIQIPSLVQMKKDLDAFINSAIVQ